MSEIMFPMKQIAITKGYHGGYCIDIGRKANSNWETNRPVLACYEGTVKSVEKQPNGGNVVYIEHKKDGKTFYSCYAHLKDGSIKVKTGDKVSTLQQIGISGASGTVTGIHLHFGLFTTWANRYKNSDIKVFDACYVDDSYELSESAMKYNIKKYVKPSTTIKYVTADLYLRTGAGTSNKAINTLPKGTKVNAYETNGTWARIGDKQWVSNNYLTTTKPSTVYETKTVTAKDGLNVRKAPNGTILKENAPLPNGTIVAIMGTSGNWTEINKDRYVYSAYLK